MVLVRRPWDVSFPSHGNAAAVLIPLRTRNRRCCFRQIGHSSARSSSYAGPSHRLLPVVFQSTILKTGLDLRPNVVIIGAASSATTGSALGCADRIRAMASPRLITASRPPQLEVENVNISAESGST